MRVSVVVLSAAVGVTASHAVARSFTLSRHAFGEDGGQPYRTSDGSGFYIGVGSDTGDGTPSLMRPLNHSGWEGNSAAEWQTYLTQDRLGPSRYPGAPNNASDQFYLNNPAPGAGVYPEGFARRNCTAVQLGPALGGGEPEAVAARLAIVNKGVLSGSAFFVGPATPSGRSPAPGVQYLNESGIPSIAHPDGLMLARLTVRRGVTISGAARVRATIGGQSQNIDLILNGPAVETAPGNVLDGLQLRAFLVGQVLVEGLQFGGGYPFDQADVYDVWVTEARVEVPGASTAAVFATIALGSARRRRAWSFCRAPA